MRLHPKTGETCKISHKGWNVMKNFRAGFLYRISLAGVLLSCCAQAAIRFTSNDPYPVFTAQNPLAWYTFWHDCEPESPYDFSISLFRQVAHKGRTGPFFSGACSTQATTACSLPNCAPCCDKDVPIGNIHGPWNMLALLYPEPNGNSTVADNIINALELTTPDLYGVAAPGPIVTYISQPWNTDPTKQFGFFSVPIDYTKYGVRFQADFMISCDFGVRLQAGVVSIRQIAKFLDRSYCALDNMAPYISTPAAPNTVTSCTPNLSTSCCPQEGGTMNVCNQTQACCQINQYNCNDKILVINGIMKQVRDIATILGFDIDNFCETNVEDLIFSMYWTHCWEFNTDTDNPCWPDYTFAPFAVGEISAPFSKQQNVNRLFSVPFGLDRHWGYGFTGGFTLNFIETIELGFDAGFTRYSEELYCNYPVPTNELQEGMFPRKADLRKRPGTTWSFGATMGAYHFLSCLSAYVQFRLLHHCDDHFCILNAIPVTPITPDAPDDDFTISNILVGKMKEESMWSSSFVDVHLDYDITDTMQLGFFWQAPVAQKYAYRPTTVMGSLIFKF